MQTALRIENTDGTGPYRSCNALPDALKDTLFQHHMDDTQYHPCPLNEFGREIYNSYKGSVNQHVGFENLRQCYNWFTKDDIILLVESGFSLVIYESIKIVVAGTYQIIFEE